MRNILLIAVLVGGCLGDDITVSDACNQQTCMELGTMTLEFFGDGRDGDFLPLAGSVITLTRDMYWRDLIFSSGAHPGAPTRIDPNGYRIFVSRTMRGPGLDAFGNIQAFISRDGRDANPDASDPGDGYQFTGTLTGGSAHGGEGDIGNGHGEAGFPNPGGLGVWPAQLHPGVGGNGGNGNLFTGGIGVGAAVASDSAGSLDLLNAIRLTLSDGTPISGGAGGATGAGDATNTFIGGSGGGGGGNIVVLARKVENASTILVSSMGGSGSDAKGPGAGGGGGGGGGYITMVVQSLPFPTMAVNGGSEGSYVSGGSPGSPGGDGVILPFCFTITP